MKTALEVPVMLLSLPAAFHRRVADEVRDASAGHEACASLDEIAHRFSCATHAAVARLAENPDEITAVLVAMFRAALAIAHARGEKTGAANERTTNPALRAVGEAIAMARKTERDAARNIAGAAALKALE